MFAEYVLTFNPGWNQNAEKLDEFDDIRKIQLHLKEKGIEIQDEADENSSGPGSFMIHDPDGNSIIFDQHI